MSARTCFAATRLVLEDGYGEVPHSPAHPGTPEEIAAHVDWPATWSLRRRLDTLGFGVAEAMDTAQRFSVGWATAERLIRGCGELGLAHGFVAGASSDHLPGRPSLEALAAGLAWQVGVIEESGGVAVLLPVVELARRGTDEQGYCDFYRAVLERVRGPLIVHWLGPQFLPALEGYFPGASFERVMALDRDKIAGAKLSLLDAGLELRLRRELQAHGQILFTGDDLHFARLILGGDPQGEPPASVPQATGRRELLGRSVPLGDFSHALLGVLDGIARPARTALERLEAGDVGGYLARMEPLEALGRWLFQPPTPGYRAGLAHLAWRAGLQSNPFLANHEEQARDAEHYRQACELARRAGALDPEPREEPRS